MKKFFDLSVNEYEELIDNCLAQLDEFSPGSDLVSMSVVTEDGMIVPELVSRDFVEIEKRKMMAFLEKRDKLNKE